MPSEKILIIGKKGEIFTTKEIRSKAGIKEGGKVMARVVDGKLVVEAIPSIAEVLRGSVLKIDAAMVERLSEESQKEQGIFG